MKNFSYNQTLKYLYNLQKFGIKLGLEKTYKLLELIGNPHHKFKSIHIAGTNGKGSTSAMIASVLTASGYKTGLYTSPHLVSFNERIRINGVPITNSELVDYVKNFYKYFKLIKPTFFEATTVIAFKYFADKKIDIAVIETGMGGRLDATNVINPLLSIITSISFDHTQYLGNTLEKIAFEKAGIIKPFTPCITAVDNPSVLKVFEESADQRYSNIIRVANISSLKFTKCDLNYSQLNLKIEKKIFKNLAIDFVGNFQKNNILMSAFAINMLRNKYGFNKINEKTIRMGFANIRKFSGLRGRMEKISENPLIIGDVAHNPEAFCRLKETLIKLGVINAITIFGLMKDKDLKPIISEIIKFSKIVIATGVRTERALPSEIITKLFRQLNFPCINGKNIKNSLKIAKKMYNTGDIILITGSHYVLGEALNLIKS